MVALFPFVVPSSGWGVLHWVSTVKNYGNQIFMDCKGRAANNAFIEGFWGKINRKHIYLNPVEYGLELY